MLIELALILVAVYTLWHSLKKPSNTPPGVWGIPLIGHIPLGAKSIDAVFQNLNKTYGDIVSWRLGTKHVVILYDYKMAKDAFNGLDFINRPEMKAFSLVSGEDILGVVPTNGVHWQNIRRFSIRHLKDLGMGKSKMVSNIHFEATEFVNEMKKQAGKPAPIPRSLLVSVLNVIWQLVASKRYDLHDPEILKFDELLTNIQENFAKLSLPIFFTWMDTVLPEFVTDFILNRYTRDQFTVQLREFVQMDIDEHIKTLDENNPRDFIDDYLIEMKKEKSDYNTTMSNEDLVFCIADFFGAGSETTSNTLRWAIFYLATYPEVQKKLQEEIDNVLPRGAIVTLEDRSRLPYTEAFTHEVLRYSCLIPVGVFHEAVRDTKLGGYHIPKETILVHSTAKIHFDPKFFDSPKVFRPERFLDSSGKFVTPKEGFLPFGTGKRQCLGELLARMELLVFLTTMVQTLNFSVPPGATIDLEPIENILIVNLPKDQKVLTTIRS